ncbi:hypothetical protein [Neisseria mucosa]|nr:hypothetical protein [Neisseria mucosa]
MNGWVGLGRVEWIKEMFAAAWLPSGEKVLYRNRQGSSESSETIL